MAVAWAVASGLAAEAEAAAVLAAVAARAAAAGFWTLPERRRGSAGHRARRYRKQG